MSSNPCTFTYAPTKSPADDPCEVRAWEADLFTRYLEIVSDGLIFAKHYLVDAALDDRCWTTEPDKDITGNHNKAGGQVYTDQVGYIFLISVRLYYSGGEGEAAGMYTHNPPREGPVNWFLPSSSTYNVVLGIPKASVQGGTRLIVYRDEFRNVLADTQVHINGIVEKVRGLIAQWRNPGGRGRLQPGETVDVKCSEFAGAILDMVEKCTGQRRPPTDRFGETTQHVPSPPQFGIDLAEYTRKMTRELLRREAIGAGGGEENDAMVRARARSTLTSKRAVPTSWAGLDAKNTPSHARYIHEVGSPEGVYTWSYTSRRGSK